MKKIAFLILAIFLYSTVAQAGSGFSVWEKLAAEGSISDNDMFAITDVSDTTQSADGSSKTVTGTQLKSYLRIYVPPTACTDGLIYGDGGRNLTTDPPNPIDPLEFESDGSYNCKYNNFFGIGAGLANTSGNLNFFAGWNAGLHNTIGDQNVFIGARAGDANTSGYHNTYLGVGAGQVNVEGIHNVFVGTDAGLIQASGSYNVLVGSSTGSTAGSYNTIVGYAAGNKNTGDNLLAFGSNAGGDNTTGDGNIFIGNAANSTAAGTESNVLIIGNDLRATKANQVILGNASVMETILRGKVGIGGSDPTYRLELTDTYDVYEGTTIAIKNTPNGYNLGDVQGQIKFVGSAGNALPLQFSESSIRSVKDDSNGNGGTRLDFWTQSGASTARKMSLSKSGGLSLLGTVTAALTTGNQTIDKPIGSVNFAAAASSLTVTNSLVTATSIINCTVGTNDTTMKSASCVAGSGSFVIYPDAAPTAETRVNFAITNVL